MSPPDPIVLALAAAIREIAARRAAEQAERQAKETAERRVAIPRRRAV